MGRKRIIIWLSPQIRIKLAVAAVMVALLAYIFSNGFSSTKIWTYWTMPLSGKVIAIDAGHGGPDGGASSDEGVIEKHINLAISLYLRDYLQQAGAVVVMTREKDTDLASEGTRGLSRRKTEDLMRRVLFVKEKKADMLISIHLNSIPNSRWHGAQSFYYPANEEGKLLATLIQDQIKKNLQNTNREANTVNTIYLLKQLKIPAALVEVGFLSNPDEARMLGQEKYQKKLAAAIYRGILKYSSGEKVGSS